MSYLHYSELHFGASTRKYMVRERPQQSVDMEDGGWNAQSKGVNFGLPEDETELEHLTEYNTAQNRIIDKAVIGKRVGPLVCVCVRAHACVLATMEEHILPRCFKNV